MCVYFLLCIDGKSARVASHRAGRRSSAVSSSPYPGVRYSVAVQRGWGSQRVHSSQRYSYIFSQNKYPVCFFNFLIWYGTLKGRTKDSRGIFKREWKSYLQKCNVSPASSVWPRLLYSINRRIIFCFTSLLFFFFSPLFGGGAGVRIFGYPHGSATTIDNWYFLCRKENSLDISSLNSYLWHGIVIKYSN